MATGANGFVNAGYRGIAEIDGTLVRFADTSIAAKQEVESPQLVSGDWDRDAYIFGKIDVGGSISGPITETFLSGANNVIQWACGRDDTGDACGGMDARDIHLYYYCNRDRLFENLFVNNFSFSVAAGEIAQFNMDVIGTFVNDWESNAPPHFTTSEKLLTWDKLSISIIPGTGDPTSTDIPADLTDINFSNFEFSVNNNVSVQYGLGQANLFPFDIVPGIREISGSLTVFNAPDFNGFDTFEDYCADGVHTLQFGLSSACTGGSATVEMKVRFHRVEPSLSPDVVTSTLGFTAVTHQSGYPWDLSASP